MKKQVMKKFEVTLVFDSGKFDPIRETYTVEAADRDGAEMSACKQYRNGRKMFGWLNRVVKVEA